MQWTNQELDELAIFFAKRLTVDLKPLDPTDPPPLGDPGGAWSEALQAAHARGELPLMARRIAAVCPSDANLQQACRLLGEGQRRNLMPMLGAALSIGAVLGLVGFGATMAAGYLHTSASPGATALQPQAIELAQVEEPAGAEEPGAGATEPDDRGTPPLPEAEPGHADESGDALDETQAPEMPSDPAPELTPAAATDAAPQGEARAAPLASVSRCSGTPGEVVGYWYAGSDKPGRKGESITLDRTVNVRSDYPDTHNGFQKRSPVQCVLMVGDRVKLVQAPLKVPGDAYWVPLVAGSIELPSS